MTNNKLSLTNSFVVLYVLTIVAQLANIAYESHINQSDFISQLLPSLVFLTVLTTPALLIGLLLGREIGIGPFYNQNPISNSELKNAVLFALISGVLLGLFLLMLRWALLPYLPDGIPQFGFRGVMGGILVSLGASIGEEIWFRFGLMTLALWLTKKIFKLNSLDDKHAFIVIVVVGLLFGLAHLPQLASFNADTPFAVWATILGNVAVSILYGWCFWRFGLVCAIVAHFSVDIVLHGLPAFF
ncbi:MAG: hypothetical protein ACJAVV_001457 [Alphaproteobacteria bacterium]|jgi:hypothetical protein